MNHLTESQRYAICTMLQTGTSQKDMATAIGGNKSTISRELRRNCDLRSGKYVMGLAQRKADKRQQGKRRRCLFSESIKEQVKEMLGRKLSPEQVAGRCKVDGIPMVSHQTLYKWIWADKRTGGEPHTHLCRRGRKYVIEGRQGIVGA